MGGDWREKAGGLMCVGHTSTTLEDRTKGLLDAGVCGVILRPPAIFDPMAVARLVDAIKSYAKRPVFVGVDQESLQGASAWEGFSRLPPGRVLGATADIELARRIGEVMGRQLRAVGVDLTLGPCVEVSDEMAECPCDRGLGPNADVASRISAALVEGQQSEGVAACVRHFPGHGKSCDSRGKEMPRVPHGVARLEEVELRPFRAAAQSRVAGMTLGHIMLDAIDERAPASLSRPIVFGILRQKLKYRGLLMIDDIDGRPLAGSFSRDDIARLGVQSGADCFLCLTRPESAFELIGAIERAVRLDEILPERIESARRRIAPIVHRYVRKSVGPSPDLSGFEETAEWFDGSAFGLDPRIDAASHVSPRSLTADEEEHHN